MKKLYLRALSITTLRSMAYLLILLVGVLFIGDRISPVLLSTMYVAIYFINAFLFAEWMFTGIHIKIQHLATIVVGTFIWDAFLSLLVMSWMQGRNLFINQPFWPNALLFLIHVIALSAAYILKKRMHATQSLAEGLES